MSISHEYLVKRALAWVFTTRKCRRCLTEQWTFQGESPDVIGWYWDGWSVLVECKISLSDFYSDSAKERKHAAKSGQPARAGQERWFLTPPGLLRPDQVQDGWGLIETEEGKRIRRVVPAARRRGVDELDPKRTVAEVRLLIR